MSSTDNRIVKMQFDNAEFKKKAAETQKSLADVNKAVDSAGKGKGLLDLNSNMQRVQVSASKMAVVTTTALATITSKAVNAGINIAKALTLDPIRSGFGEYESLLNKQNVIMNATGKSAAQVKKVLNDLNHYSDKTIFSFGDMTEALTSFVNAGVPLKQASQAMKGIANASALAGASTQEAQSSFRAFSQALGQGFLGLQDWRQAAVTGKIGTVQFKQTLIDAAVAAGTLTKRGKEYVTQTGKTLTATKNFDLTLQEQWASTEVLNTALRNYSDTNTKLGKKAQNAAQEVRTFTAFMDTLKESLGSGWAQVFTQLFGGLEEATSMWTGLSNKVSSVVGGFFNWASVTLQTWRTMGGFTKLMEGFGNVLAPIGALLRAVGDAFHAAFPESGKGAGKALYGLSAGFAALTTPLQWLANLISLLTSPLTLFFQIIKIGGAAVREAGGFIGDFVSKIFGMVDLKAPSGGGFLGWIKDIGGAIADAVDQISDLLDKGKSLGEAFSGVKFKMPKLPSLPNFGNMFGGAGDAAGGGAKRAQSTMAKLKKPMDALVKGFKAVRKGFKDVASSVLDSGDDIQAVTSKIGDGLGKLWEGLKNFLGKLDWEKIMASFNLAVLSTFVISFSRLMNALTPGIKALSEGIDVVPKILEQTGGAVKAFQTQARAQLILNIAIALGILAVSLWLLSKIPAAKLLTGLATIAVIAQIMTKTLDSMTGAITKMDGAKAGVKMITLAVSIGILAGAMILLSLSLLIMNKVKWGSIVKGIVTMRVLMGSMEALGDSSKMSAKNLIAGGIAIGIVAASMLVLAAALIAFRLVKPKDMLKAGAALTGVALAVGALALIPYEGIAKIGLALLATSVGMIAIAAALIIFKKVKWESIFKLSLVLTALAVALGVMVAEGGPVAASTIVGVAAAVVLLALAGMMFNKVDWTSIAKLFVVLTGLTLVILVLGTALAVFLYVIAPVAPVLIILAAGFALLGVGLLAFAAAMAIAMALGAAGTAAFAALATGAAVAIAVFLQTLALQAPIMKRSFLDILQALIDTIVEAAPMIIQGFKDLWEACNKAMFGEDKKKASKDGGKSWIQKVYEGIMEKMPAIVAGASLLIIKFLLELSKKASRFSAAGVQLLVQFIRGVDSKIDSITDSVADLIRHFIASIGQHGTEILNAGVAMVATFLHDLADTIRSGSGAIGDGLADVGDAMWDVGKNVAKGLGGGILAGAPDVNSAIGSVVGGAVGLAGKLFKVNSPSKVFYQIGKFVVQGLTNGIQNNAVAAITAVSSMVSGQIAVANELVSGYIQKLDQQAIAARAKADGLAAAAERAAKAADKTKSKKDDKAAENLQIRADKASTKATAAEKKAEAAKASQDRAEQFRNASTLEKAQMRSEDSQNQLEAAKASEARAAKAVVQANALDRQSRQAGVTAKQRKAMQKEADALRAQAARDAALANKQLANAKTYAAQALVLQKTAGDEAIAAFEEQFKAEATADAEAEAFNKLSNAEKAELRRKQADELQKKAEADLATAKKLAYTDIAAANDLAQQAMNEADQARQYLIDAQGFENSGAQGVGAGGANGTVVNLAPTDAAAVAMNDYADLYSSATAAAAGDRTVEFNQYNTSPEALSPTEVYRQTNNVFTFAVEKIDSLL